MGMWLILAFAAGTMVGAACGVVVMAVLMISKETERTSPQWWDHAVVRVSTSAR